MQRVAVHTLSRCGFCPPDMPDFKQLLEDADDQLFERILNNPHHTLYTDIAKFAGHLPHRYGNSRAIWDMAEVTIPPLPQPKLVLD